MTNPVTVAPSWLPVIGDCDGLEIHPCCVIGFSDDMEIVEVCEPDEADFFTVYGHCREGGVTAFEDFQTVIAAREFAERLLETYPNLRHHSLLDCGS